MAKAMYLTPGPWNCVATGRDLDQITQLSTEQSMDPDPPRGRIKFASSRSMDVGLYATSASL